MIIINTFKLKDLESILIPKHIELFIVGKNQTKHFFFDTNTGEFKERGCNLDMFNLYGEYQVDTIFENKYYPQCICIQIRKK